jgi:hypothetical protein
MMIEGSGSGRQKKTWIRIRNTDWQIQLITYLLMIDWQDGENDELFISMVDDTTERKVTIPAAFLLGKNG